LKTFHYKPPASLGSHLTAALTTVPGYHFLAKRSLFLPWLKNFLERYFYLQQVSIKFSKIK
jgi:hypothetical protein